MPIDSEKLTVIGIECEQIEDQNSWGISRVLSKTLEQLAQRPELRGRYRFILFFKSKIPGYAFLNNPIFEKKVVSQPFPYRSFVLYYYVFLPLHLLFSRISIMYYPNYMLPIIHPPWIPSLVLLTDDIWHEMRSSQQRFHHRLAYWVFGYWGVWMARRFMAISEASKKELMRLFHIKSERISVNHLAAHVEHTDTVVPHPRPFILFVGQSFPRRHLKETLLAFEKIAPEFPDLDFIIIGPDRYHPAIIDTLAHRINTALGRERILHISHVADEALARYYANGAQLTTYISSREAFGLPPLEALGHGSIPVVADNDLSHEIFGTCAFFVKKPSLVDSIAHTLRQALTDTEKRAQILRDRHALLQRYTWSAHADRFLNIIDEILHT